MTDLPFLLYKGLNSTKALKDVFEYSGQNRKKTGWGINDGTTGENQTIRTRNALVAGG